MIHGKSPEVVGENTVPGILARDVRVLGDGGDVVMHKLPVQTVDVHQSGREASHRRQEQRRWSPLHLGSTRDMFGLKKKLGMR